MANDPLDNFIKNIFQFDKPSLSRDDYEDEGVWVCDFLDQDVDTANDYIQYRLEIAKNKMEKLQFLYATRSCVKGSVEGMKGSLESHSYDFDFYRRNYSDGEIKQRLTTYTAALHRIELAIQFYIDCKELDCKGDGEKSIACNYTQGQIVLIFYFFLSYCGITTRENFDIAPVAKFIHLVTGIKFTETTNSNIYKKLKKAPSFKATKPLLEDLEAIKPLFTYHNLNEVIPLIEEVIAKTKNELAHSNQL